MQPGRIEDLRWQYAIAIVILWGFCLDVLEVCVDFVCVSQCVQMCSPRHHVGLLLGRPRGVCSLTRMCSLARMCSLECGLQRS